MIGFDDLSPGPDGLVPAIVQVASTGDVAMVGYMDAEAFAATRDSGYVHFRSRSRDELWKKGATSGNTLAVRSITADCDADALLVVAEPSGPVCHTGTATCFGDGPAPSLGRVVDRLTGIIADRADADPAGSYTARLLRDRDLAARKVLEEAGELAFAVKDLPDGDLERVVEEAADLVYHALALVTAAGADPSEVAGELLGRMR